MRPGALFAAVCLGGLGYWYLAQSDGLSALLMFALAAALSVVGVLPPGRRLGVARQHTHPGPTDPAPLADVPERLRSIRAWRAIAVTGLAASVASAFVFPPLALVLAGLAIYALHRIRRERAHAA